MSDQAPSSSRPLILFGASVLLFVGGAVIATRVSAPTSPATAPTTTMPAPMATTSSPSPSSPPALPSPTAPTPLGEAPLLPSMTVLRDGRPLPLDGPRQKPTLLHLWATWCGPCREELPAILEYGRLGTVEVIALSVDDDWASVTAYFNDAVPPEVAWDPKVVVEPTMGVRSLPTTIVIDKSGRVQRTIVGAQDWRRPDLRNAIAQLGR